MNPSNKIIIVLIFCLIINEMQFEIIDSKNNVDNVDDKLVKSEINSKNLKKKNSKRQLLNTQKNISINNSSQNLSKVLYMEHLIRPESKSLITNSILFFIFFISIYFLLSNEYVQKNIYRFPRKCLKILSEKMFVYFIFIAFIFICYTFGILDFAKINWQHFISNMLILAILWIFICRIIIIYSDRFIKKIIQLEENTKNLSKFPL